VSLDKWQFMAFLDSSPLSILRVLVHLSFPTPRFTVFSFALAVAAKRKQDSHACDRPSLFWPPTFKILPPPLVRSERLMATQQEGLSSFTKFLVIRSIFLVALDFLPPSFISPYCQFLVYSVVSDVDVESHLRSSACSRLPPFPPHPSSSHFSIHLL